MATINFEGVKYRAEKKVACRCGKATTRRKTFECTINPFNRNPDGTVKARAEVYEQAKQYAARWKPGPYVCKACKQENSDGP